MRIRSSACGVQEVASCASDAWAEILEMWPQKLAKSILEQEKTIFEDRCCYDTEWLVFFKRLSVAALLLKIYARLESGVKIMNG